METLRTEFGGTEFRSPVLVPALTPMCPTTSEDYVKILLKIARAGAGAIITPSTSYMEEKRASRGMGRFSKMVGGSKFGICGIRYMSNPMSTIMFSVEEIKYIINELFKELHKNGLDLPLIVSIMSGSYPEEWVTLAEDILSTEKVDILHCNFGCPITSSVLQKLSENKELKASGALLTQLPEIAGDCAKQILRNVDVPVIFKHSPEIGYPLHISQLSNSLYNSGAKFIELANSVITVWEPDIWNDGKPSGLETLGGYWTTSGASGPFTRFITWKFLIWWKMNYPDVQVMGTCGIVEPQHAIQTIMLGADVVGVSPGFLWRGARIIKTINNYILKFMKLKNYESIDEFKGESLKYFASAETIKFKKAKAKIDREKCTKCGICVETLCSACYEENGNYFVDEDKCGGCNLCSIFCPTGAIYLEILE